MVTEGYPGSGAKSNAKTQNKNQTQLTVKVPEDAQPGETQLRVLLEGDNDLVVTVPKYAVAGDELIMSKIDETGKWSLRVQKQNDNSIMKIPVESYEKTETGQSLLRVRVPDRAVPGSTEIEIEVKSGEQALNVLRLPVPEENKPGDELVIFQDEELRWIIKAPVPDAMQNENWTPDAPQVDVDPIKEIKLTRINLDADDCYKKMLLCAEPLKEFGCFISPKVTRGMAPPINVPGLICTEAVEEGEELVRMPACLHMSPATLRSVLPDLFKAIENMKVKSIGNTTDVALAAGVACFLQLAADSAKNGTLPEDAQDSGLADLPQLLHRYSTALLGEHFETHPQYMLLRNPDELFRILEPSEEAEIARETLQDFLKSATLIKNICGEDALKPGFEIGQLLHAKLCLVSREFGTPHGSSLVPVVDLVNHSNKPNAVVQWNAEEMTTLRSLRPIAAGEEVFIKYEALSNPMMLRQYGFTLPPEEEPAWTSATKVVRHYRHQKARLAGITIDTSLLVDGPWDQLVVRVALLELHSLYITDSLGMAFQACATTPTNKGRDAAEFLYSYCVQKMDLYEKDEKIQPALDALKRAREADPTSGAWWNEMPREKMQGNDLLGIRVKMSEYLSFLAHREALDAIAGRVPEEKCLAHSAPLRKALAEALVVVVEGGRFECTVGCAAEKCQKIWIQIPKPTSS